LRCKIFRSSQLTGISLGEAYSIFIFRRNQCDFDTLLNFIRQSSEQHKMRSSRTRDGRNQSQYLLPRFERLLRSLFLAPGDHLSHLQIQDPDNLQGEVKGYCFQRFLRGEGEDAEHTIPLAIMLWHPSTEDRVQPDIQKIIQHTIASEFEEHIHLYTMCGYDNGGYKIPFVICRGSLISFGSYTINTGLCPIQCFAITPRSFSDCLEGVWFKPILIESNYCIYSRQKYWPACHLFWPGQDRDEIREILQTLKTAMVSFGEILHARHESLLSFGLDLIPTSPF
jgi:hypothetical protein